MTDQPEINHRAYTLNHIPDTYITSTLKYLAENSVSFPKLFVKNILEPWINADLQIVAHLSKIYARNKHSKETEQTYNGREYLKNILSSVDFTRVCNVMQKFTEFNRNI